ncbi:MAG: hypothetical protein JAZ17_08410 [Candidatus Thiodiazotropha endolucinida]|nr:hypothetical protein [Candidatus Thiodiazotropha endolucinida]
MDYIQPHPPFENFDPKISHPTQHYLDVLTSVLIETRQILYERSRSDIEFIADSISYMLDQYEPLEINADRLVELEKKNKEEVDEVFRKQLFEDVEPEKDPAFPVREVYSRFDHPFLGPCAALNTMVGYYEIKNQPELENAKWSEYFAVLALALIGESTSIPKVISKDIKKDKINDFYRESFNISYFVIEAMKASSVANKFRTLESGVEQIKQIAEEQVKQKVHLSQQLGGIKRHAENNRVKSNFIRFCENSFIPALNNDEKLNITAAAREFYEEFLEDHAPDKYKDPDGAFKHRENTLRMLTTAWRNYKKTGQQPNQP